MKMSKKIVLMSSLVATSLFGEVATILPYYANIGYASNNSLKDKGTLGGVYMSYGNLNYLVDLDVASTTIDYKDPTLSSTLKQTDVTASYAQFFPTFMYKIGIHNINTTDTDLGDGNTLITALGGYKYYGYDKLTYGIEGYWTRYGSGHDDNGVAQTINVYQATPYIGYSKAIDINSRNNLNVKLNYIYASKFNTKDYTSLNVVDTYYYKNFYSALSGYTGEMKAAVQDGGHTVYNLKDLVKNGYGVKFGYYLSKDLNLDVAYNRNNFVENGFIDETSNNIFLTSLRYSF